MTILYFYITVFTLYFIVLTLAGAKPKKKIRDKYTQVDSNICVVVYATGAVKTLENLIKQLKHQTYPQDKYTVYALLDKCEELQDVTLQTDLEVNIVNINNMEPIGKSQAYSIIAEKLAEAENLDAYVFLDANNYVDSNFLSTVNYYLTKHDVFMPSIGYLPNESGFTFWQNVKSTYSRYISNFIYKSRTRLNLTNLINTDAFVIKKHVLDKIECFDFKDKTSEVIYTVKLAKEGYVCAHIDDLYVYTSIDNYDSRIPSVSKRLSIFWNNITHMPNFKAQEFLCSLAAPNWLVIILIYALLLKRSFILPFVVSYTTILITTIIFILAFCASLINAKIYAKEFVYLFAYPLMSLGHLISNFPPIRGIRNLIFNKNKKHNIEKMSTEIIVTDGKKEFKCTMELISDNGLAKVKFINKGKVYVTKNNHLRMVDAIKELSDKLSDYGLSLKICQCCKYFQPIIDGSTNMIKGTCNCQFEGRVVGDVIPTLVWNTCPNFEQNNIVNLF